MNSKKSRRGCNEHDGKRRKGRPVKSGRSETQKEPRRSVVSRKGIDTTDG